MIWESSDSGIRHTLAQRAVHVTSPPYHWVHLADMTDTAAVFTGSGSENLKKT